MESKQKVPIRVVTANQVVAWNIAWLRREAGMKQRELADLLGWPENKVSEAETSWNGKRTREFDAETIVALAVALGVPVNAFFLPPADDGEEVSYVIRPPGSTEELDMADLLAISITDTDEQTDVMTSYRRRLLASVGRYLGEEWEHEVAGWLRRLIGREAIKEGAFRLLGVAESMTASIGLIKSFASALNKSAEEGGDE